jgi:hypothetical protein
MESTLSLEVEMEQELFNGELINITFSNLGESEGALNLFQETCRSSINTPVVEFEPVTPTTPAGAQTEHQEDSMATESPAIEPPATEPAATTTAGDQTAPANEDGEMATNHQDWSQWREDQAPDTVTRSDPTYYSDTAESSAGSVGGNEEVKARMAQLKKEVSRYKLKVATMATNRHTLIVVLQNAWERHNDTKLMLAAVNHKADELEIDLAIKDFELKIATGTVAILKKQLEESRTIIGQLEADLRSEKGQSKALNVEKIRLEGEARDVTINQIFPF